MTLDLCQVFTAQTVAPPPHGRPPHPTCAPGWGRGRRVRGWRRGEPAARTARLGKGGEFPPEPNPIDWVTGLRSPRSSAPPHQQTAKGSGRKRSCVKSRSPTWIMVGTRPDYSSLAPFSSSSPRRGGRLVGGQKRTWVRPLGLCSLMHACAEG